MGARLIWSGAMMLEFLGNSDANYQVASDAMMRAIDTALAQGSKTPDLDGTASTTECAKAIAATL